MLAAGAAVRPWRWLPAGGPGALEGTVAGMGGAPLAGARLTLVDQRLGLLREVRSGRDGRFRVDGLPAGEYRLGAAAPGHAYREVSVPVPSSGGAADPVRLALPADDATGRWTRIGDTSPEFLGATNSGTLMPDGRINYCHDTEDPVLFDPRDGAKVVAQGSGSAQGCHATTVLLDGRVLFAGGQDGDDPGTFRNAVPWVKLYDPATDTWRRGPDMNSPRWYPTLTRLPGGRLLVTGGGLPPDARRTDTAEIYDPETGRWTLTGKMLNPAEFGPSVLLFTGEVLRSWWPPQLYDLGSGQWRATGDFVQADRGYPDHSPHSLVLLPDGRAAAVGMKKGPYEAPSMLELYDPASGRWSLGPTPETLRSYPEVLLLPDGRVLAAGGKKEMVGQPGATNRWGYTALADLYDSATDSWRAVAPMPIAREYHALTILAPDGRVIVTAGTGAPGQGGDGTDNRVDAYEPPYLFRGPRPVIEGLSTSELRHGESFSLRFSATVAPTKAVLVGLNAVTHYVDGGAGRLVALPFEVAGDQLTARVPPDEVRLPAAHYLLFVLVDDVPSEGRIVRLTGESAPPSPTASAGPTASRTPGATPPAPAPTPAPVHLPYADRGQR